MGHRRLIVLAVLTLALLPAAGQAQRVNLGVRLTPDTLVSGRMMRLPVVQTRQLLAGRWGEALRRSFPLRLQYRIEIWRSREGWIDQLERTVEWGLVVRHEALFDQYTVTHPAALGVQEVILPTWDALEQYLNKDQVILARPGGRATYYFHVQLVIMTLSDADVDELERFVRGEPTEPDRERAPSTRAFLRFILRATGGLQTETVDARTGKFVVR